jgi:hypothetical protein
MYNDDGTIDETAIECTEGCGNHNDPGTIFCDLCGERQGNGLLAQYPVFVEKNFSQAHMDVIVKAIGILDDYERQGYMLTLRQLYYQFVSSDSSFPNTDQSYKRLGGIITDARLAGLISFERIEDRGRNVDEPYTQPNPKQVLDSVAFHYIEDLWADQDTYVEVWVEKDALSSVIERPCNKYQVPFMACKGYMSTSALWAAGQRFAEARKRGKECAMIHLGDHDPSGIDMTRDNERRLEMFSDGYVDVRRVALNRDQVEHYAPPPNPTKLSDSRAADYIAVHGRKSWELDALKPDVIGKLITSELDDVLDVVNWNRALERQRHNRAEIRKVSDNPNAVWEHVGAKFK